MAREYFEHRTAPGERWDLIAHDYYGDATLIRPILLANPELVANPDQATPLILKPGIVVKVPVLEDAEISQAQLPPWKTGLAR